MDKEGDGGACTASSNAQEDVGSTTEKTNGETEGVTDEQEMKAEVISVDEAPEQLAIPTEPVKRTTGNQITDTYYYYQGSQKHSFF